MARMHPRHRYFHRPTDFWELAEFRPSLKPYLLLKGRFKGEQIPHEAPPTEDKAADGPFGSVSHPADPSPFSVSPPCQIPAYYDFSDPIPTYDTVSVSDEPSIPAPSDPSDPSIPAPSDPSDPIRTHEETSASIPTSKSVPAEAKRRKKFAYTLDFSKPEAVRELTYAVLEKDFGLQLEIPEDCLIPTIPQKLNYIHWVEDLLCCRDESGEEMIPKGKETVGIDIGTGMSCIYALLGSKLNQWSFIATDITLATVQCATANVSRNGLQDYIKVELVAEDSMLKEVVEASGFAQCAFSMCNPPFFKNKEEQQSGCARSRPLPSTFSRGSEKETITEGGEVGFVKRMIQDSLVLQERVRWYTTMLGKKSSLKELQSELTSLQVPVVTTTEFIQGKTWRWGLAWSFDESLKDKVAKVKRKRKQSQSHSCLQFRVVGGNGSVPSPTPAGIHGVKKWLEEEFDQLEVTRTVEPFKESCDTTVKMKCFAERAMWSHSRKVRRLRERLNFHSQCSTIQAPIVPDVTEDQRQLTESSLAEIKQNLQSGINSLCKICNMEFTACIRLQEQPLSGLTSLKKKKMEGKRLWKKKKAGCTELGKGGQEGGNGTVWDKEMGVGEDKCVCVELEWVRGDQETDYLHQLLQYFQNRMSTSGVDFH